GAQRDREKGGVTARHPPPRSRHPPWTRPRCTPPMRQPLDPGPGAARERAQTGRRSPRLQSPPPTHPPCVPDKFPSVKENPLPGPERISVKKSLFRSQRPSGSSRTTRKPAVSSYVWLGPLYARAAPRKCGGSSCENEPPRRTPQSRASE